MSASQWLVWVLFRCPYQGSRYRRHTPEYVYALHCKTPIFFLCGCDAICDRLSVYFCSRESFITQINTDYVNKTIEKVTQ